MGSRLLRHVLFLLLLAVMGGTLTSVSAGLRAQELPLAPLSCIGGAGSAGAAFALSRDELACGSEKFAERPRFVRTHADVSRAFLPPAEMLLWQTDPSAFDAMLLRFTYADGSERLIDIDPQMAARNWFVRSRFSVPVPRAASPLIAVDAVIERPRTRATAREARLIGTGTAAREHFLRALAYALVAGLLLNPIIYDLLFYRVLRARFMLWHMAMTAAILVFALSTTGLIFELFPGMPLPMRYHVNSASLAIAIACAVQFARLLLEDRAIPRGLDRVLIGSVALMLAVKLVALLDLEALRLHINTVFLLSLVPVGLAVVAAVIVAVERGSRAAKFIGAAFAGMILTGMLRFAMGLGLIDLPMGVDDYLLASMVAMALGTSAGVGDRFMVIRSQRDRARLQAARLGLMAHTDGLTGLANRRAFDQIQRLESGQALIVADIDHFKRINDTMGHQMGDAVLCYAASILHQEIAKWPGVLLFRLGGEEFAIVLPCADRSRLEEFCEHVRKCFEESEGDENVDLSGLTISIGALLGRGQKLHEAFAEADGAMYRAKDLGRNRTVLAPLDAGRPFAASPDPEGPQPFKL